MWRQGDLGGSISLLFGRKYGRSEVCQGRAGSPQAGWASRVLREIINDFSLLVSNWLKATNVLILNDNGGDGVGLAFPFLFPSMVCNGDE